MYVQKLKELKEKKKLTTQQISDLSGVPASTVSRILSGQTDNPSFQSICDITIAMGGSMDELVGISQLNGENEKMKYDSDAAFIQLYRERMDEKDKELERWLKTSRILFAAFLVMVFIVTFLLVFDILNPKIGYIQY